MALRLDNNRTDIDAFLARFDTFLLDCDGVVWSGDELLPGTKDALSYLEQAGKRLIYVTNNSTASRGAQAKQFESLGIEAKESQIFTSAYSTAVYIDDVLKLQSPRNKIFVVGSEGIETELTAKGLSVIGGTDSKFDKEVVLADFEGIASGNALDPDVGAVVVGMDLKFNYLKLAHAAHYIRNGAAYIATNTDATFPILGTIFPAAGCISAALRPMVGKDPILLGKPSAAMMTAIQTRYDIDPSRTCMIGDNLDTDIKFGIDGKLGGTLLVFSGVTQPEDLFTVDEQSMPTAIIGTLGDLKPSAQ